MNYLISKLLLEFNILGSGELPRTFFKEIFTLSGVFKIGEG